MFYVIKVLPDREEWQETKSLWSQNFTGEERVKSSQNHQHMNGEHQCTSMSACDKISQQQRFCVQSSHVIRFLTESWEIKLYLLFSTREFPFPQQKATTMRLILKKKFHHKRVRELCEQAGGPGLSFPIPFFPVSNKPYGFCGHITP